jgi:hypothetical protein
MDETTPSAKPVQEKSRRSIPFDGVALVFQGGWRLGGLSSRGIPGDL